MLTKNDLQQIREVVKEEVRTEATTIVRKELKPIKSKLNRIEKDLSYVIRTYDERLVAVENDVKILQNN